MSSLIEELKQEHQSISTILVKLQGVGLSNQKGIDLLVQAKEEVFAHLKKEDELLYPLLEAKAYKDDNLKKTLEIFGKDMEKITKMVVDFYQKYSITKDINSSDFVKDFATLIITLKNRVMKEEVGIFKMYEKYASNSILM